MPLERRSKSSTNFGDFENLYGTGYSLSESHRRSCDARPAIKLSKLQRGLHQLKAWPTFQQRLKAKEIEVQCCSRYRKFLSDGSEEVIKIIECRAVWDCKDRVRAETTVFKEGPNLGANPHRNGYRLKTLTALRENFVP